MPYRRSDFLFYAEFAYYLSATSARSDRDSVGGTMKYGKYSGLGIIF